LVFCFLTDLAFHMIVRFAGHLSAYLDDLRFFVSSTVLS
jgi:hypothetical protein